MGYYQRPPSPKAVQKGRDARHDEDRSGVVLEVRRSENRRSNNADRPLSTAAIVFAHNYRHLRPTISLR